MFASQAAQNRNIPTSHPSPNIEGGKAAHGGSGSRSLSPSDHPRASGMSQIENPLGIFERMIQTIADTIDEEVGATFRKYRIIENVTELCKQPENWSKDPKRACELQFRLGELGDIACLELELTKLGTSFASTSLLQTISALTKGPGNNQLNLPAGGQTDNYKKLLQTLCKPCLDKAGLKLVVNSFFDKTMAMELRNSHLSPEDRAELRTFEGKLSLLYYEVGYLLKAAPESERQRVAQDLIPIISDKFKGGSREISERVVEYDSKIQEKNGKSGGKISTLAGQSGFNVLDDKKASQPALKLENSPGEWMECGRVVLGSALTTAAKAIKENQSLLEKKKEPFLLPVNKKLSGKVVGAGEKYISKADLRKLLKGQFAMYYASIQNANYGLPAIKNSLVALCTELNSLSSKIAPEDKNIFYSEIKKIRSREGNGSLLAKVMEELIPKRTKDQESKSTEKIKPALDAAIAFLKNVPRGASYNEVLRGKINQCFEGNYDATQASVIQIYKNLSDLEKSINDEAHGRFADLVKEKTRKYPPLNHRDSVVVTQAILEVASKFDSSEYTGAHDSTYGTLGAVKAMNDVAKEMLHMLSPARFTA